MGGLDESEPPARAQDLMMEDSYQRRPVATTNIEESNDRSNAFAQESYASPDRQIPPTDPYGAGQNFGEESAPAGSFDGRSATNSMTPNTGENNRLSN